MRINTNKAKRKQSVNTHVQEMLALLCESVAFVISINQIDTEQSKPLIYFIVILLICFVWRASLIHRRWGINIKYKREQHLNVINKSVFDALYKLNSSKIRSVLRHTYGTVPNWNPINYKDNILVYDIHEHIRSILVSLADVIISLDPIRFNDKNVSVALIYCYPDDIYHDIPNTESSSKRNNVNDAILLPLKGITYREKPFWKLISSGDTSGNVNSILNYLQKPESFYVLVDCFGTVYLNNKFDPVNFYHLKQVKTRLLEKGIDLKSHMPPVFFIGDIHDLEHTSDGQCDGSAIGTVINIKNDNPERIFIKAILTINTYGEPIFSPSTRQTLFSSKNVDDEGMRLDDYEHVIKNTILPTYVRLLEAELAQMYIRHSVKQKLRCRLTGHEISQDINPSTDIPSTCRSCIACKKPPRKNKI